MDTFEAFLKLRATEEGCLVWSGAKTTAGYGLARIDGENQYVHRVFYKLEHGEIDPNLTIDHLCRNRACAHWEHTEQVTRGENVLRGESGAANNARKTHCKNGHPFNEDNTLILKRGERVCRACARERMRDRRTP